MKTMSKQGVFLGKMRWRRILNLLTEELEVWEPTSGDCADILATILMIETQTGIRKKISFEKSNPYDQKT